MAVPQAIRRAVRERASDHCEYCRMHTAWESLHSYHIEHIVARQHRGGDGMENLALACNHCNLLKGPNLSSLDPDGCEVVRLFNPRGEAWEDHFTMESGIINGLTPTGRTTVFLLEMNASHRVDLRLENLDDW